MPLGVAPTFSSGEVMTAPDDVREEDQGPDLLRELVPAMARQESWWLADAFGSERGTARGFGFLKDRTIDAPDFDPYENIEGYEEYGRSFMFADSPEDVAAIKRKIDQELQDRDTIAAGGFGSLAVGLAMGIIDPLILVPFAGQATKAIQLARAGKKSLSALSFGYQAGRAGLLGSTAAEALLHGRQETRTWGESVVNVAASTLLSGALGGAIGIPVASRINLASRIEADMRLGNPGDPDIWQPNSQPVSKEDLDADIEDQIRAAAGPIDPQSAGAAAVTRDDVRLKTFFGSDKVDQTALGVMRQASPMLRGLTSVSKNIRQATQGLVETPYLYEGQGQAAVETLVKQWDYNLAQSLRGVDELYVRYRTGRAGEGRVARLKVQAGDTFGAGRGDQLSFIDFKKSVSKALLNNDQHDVPEVAEAARLIRETVLEPLKEDALAYVPSFTQEQIDELTESYLPRIWNVEKIRRDAYKPGGLHERLVRYFEQQQTLEADQYARAVEEAEVRQREYDELDVELHHLNDMVGVERRRMSRKGRSQKNLEREMQIAERRMTESRARAQAVYNRLRRFTVNERLAPDDPMKEVARDLKAGRRKKPVTLFEVIRQKGGLKPDGELESGLGIDISHNLVRTDGRALDDMARSLAEDGWFGAGRDGADINELLDLIDRQLGGDEVVNAEDSFADIAYNQFLDEAEFELDRMGLDLNHAPERVIADALKEGRVDDSLAIIMDTERNRARQREIAFNYRKAEFEASRGQAQVARLDDRLQRVREDLELARNRREVLEARIDDVRRRRGQARGRLNRPLRVVRNPSSLTNMSRIELEDEASQVIDKIMGTPDGRIFDITPRARGSLKERALLIPTRDVEDFVEMDIEVIMRHHNRSMAPDIEISRRFGDPDMKDVFNKIRDEKQRVLQRKSNELTADQLERLGKRFDREIETLSAMRDILRGTYAARDFRNHPLYRTQGLIKDWNYVRLLGGMTVSAFPDVARVSMTQGFLRAFGKPARAFITNLTAPKGELTGLKLAVEEVQKAGTALDLVLNTRAVALGDVGEDLGRNTKLDKTTRGFVNTFSLVSGMDHWNGGLKSWVGVLSQDRILEIAEKAFRGRHLTKNEADWARSAGLSDQDLVRIGEQFDSFGATIDGLRIANSDNWLDQSADVRRLFRAAIARDVDTAIVTPGAGDVPLHFRRGGLWGLIGQFRSFSFAAANRVMMAGLQRQDASMAIGVAQAIGLGMLTYYIKTIQSPGATLSDDPKTWVREGMERSGVMGWLWEPNNMLERATRGHLGVNAIIGGPISSRYAARGMAESILGPSLGLPQDIATVLGAAASGDPSGSDIRTVRKLMPYQNLIFVRSLFDRVESGAREALDE